MIKTIACTVLLICLNISQIDCKSNLNLRLLSEKVKTSGLEVNCKSGNTTTCVCPGNCMDHLPDTLKCKVKNCYKYDENTEKCSDSGKSLVAAILMHVFLGAFGGGVGFLHNWMWFGIWWGILGGGIVLLVCILCVCNDSNTDTKPAGYTFVSCLLSCSLLGIWIALMVMIANGSLKDQNGCPLSS